MYIDKWWGNMIGGSDDSLCLVDYLEAKKAETLPLGDILHDIMLDRYLGENPLYRSGEMFFLMHYDDGRTMEVDFMISIDPVIDLCAILVEQIHAGQVDTGALVPSSQRPVTVKIQMEKQPLKLLLDELRRFCDQPLSYDLAEMVPEEDMLELAGMCAEVAEELEGYYKTL